MEEKDKSSNLQIKKKNNYWQGKYLGIQVKVIKTLLGFQSSKKRF